LVIYVVSPWYPCVPAFGIIAPQFKSPLLEAKMRHFLPLILIAGLVLGGCSGMYRPETEQGNILTDDMLVQVKPGMSRSQVRYVLGTPLIADPFHHDRWDYYYLFRPGSTGKPAESRRVTVFFENDRVVRVETAKPAPAEAGRN
jgi:outer membrane protein assembly factor BamE